jgi:uncharacterized protein
VGHVSTGTPSAFGTGRVTFRQGSETLTLTVEVASTPEQRQRGLMGRAAVPAGTGMLFTYPGAQEWGGYWMKDTLVPLDIAFIRAGAVLEVDHMVPCHVADCPITVPKGPFDAVVEAPAGTFVAAGIRAGAVVRMDV